MIRSAVIDVHADLVVVQFHCEHRIHESVSVEITRNDACDRFLGVEALEICLMQKLIPYIRPQQNIDCLKLIPQNKDVCRRTTK